MTKSSSSTWRKSAISSLGNLGQSLQTMARLASRVRQCQTYHTEDLRAERVEPVSSALHLARDFGASRPADVHDVSEIDPSLKQPVGIIDDQRGM